MSLAQQIRDFEGGREDQKAILLMEKLETAGLVELVKTQGFQLSIGYERQIRKFSICILEDSGHELAHFKLGEIIPLNFEPLVRDWLIETLPLLQTK